MSHDKTDTQSTANDAENSAESTESGQEIRISEEELNELGNLLQAYKEILIAHEIRLSALEDKNSQGDSAAPAQVLHVVGRTGTTGSAPTDSTQTVEDSGAANTDES